MLYGLSERLQTNDFADISATTSLLKDVENDFAVSQTSGCILCHLATHAHEEEASIFPGASKFANRLVASLIEEHHALTKRELEIASATRELLGLPTPEARIRAGIRINQMANGLIADYLVHMNREENELVPLMRENLTDAEQAAIRGAIIARFPPDRLFALLGWMLPSLNVNELSELISSVKQGAPPPVVKAITDLAAAKVEAARWNEVQHRIGV
jgi:hypothetical protein